MEPDRISESGVKLSEFDIHWDYGNVELEHTVCGKSVSCPENLNEVIDKTIEHKCPPGKSIATLVRYHWNGTFREHKWPI
jgi:hypothetical protein